MTKKNTRERDAGSVVQVCHECGGEMLRDTRPLDLTYKGDTIQVDQPGWYCIKCDEVVLSSKDFAATEPFASAQRARVDGLLTPSEIRRIRTKLKLSQRRAGDVLGGGPRAFQKYERGAIGITRAMSNLLRLLDQAPQLLRKIEGSKAA
jgi:HTH-type transcriptional regulator/antitoxin MqsA